MFEENNEDLIIVFDIPNVKGTREEKVKGIVFFRTKGNSKGLVTLVAVNVDIKEII